MRFTFVLETIDHLPFQLNFLDLSSNNIKKIQGLERLKKLQILILNNNFISKIEGLQCNNRLRELYFADNFLRKVENIEHLQELEWYFPF